MTMAETNLWDENIFFWFKMFTNKYCTTVIVLMSLGLLEWTSLDTNWKGWLNDENPFIKLYIELKRIVKRWKPSFIQNWKES